MRKFTKRSVAIATAAVVAVGGAGAAYAAWLLSGDGTTTATAGTADSLQVTNVSVAPAFGPGSKNNLTFTVTNPNSFPVLITGINIPTITNKVDDKVCEDDNVVFNTGAQPTDTSVLALAPTGAGGSSTTITYKDALSMVADAQDGCQGLAFDLGIKVDARSNAA